MSRLVEASGVVDHREAQVVSPAPDIRVGRHDEGLEAGSCGHHLLSKVTPESGTLVGIELLCEARFAQRERPDRDYDAGSAHRH